MAYGLEDSFVAENLSLMQVAEVWTNIEDNDHVACVEMDETLIMVDWKNSNTVNTMANIDPMEYGNNETDQNNGVGMDDSNVWCWRWILMSCLTTWRKTPAGGDGRAVTEYRTGGNWMQPITSFENLPKLFEELFCNQKVNTDNLS